MKHRDRWLKVLLIAAPLALLGAPFLGHDPWSILAPELRGILQLRIWRTLTGAGVGAALALSGLVLQAVLRNPLADAYVLGIASGAGLAVAGGVVCGGLSLGLFFVPSAGFVGALLSLFMVYQLARVGGITSAPTLVLAGVVWSSLCGSLLMFLVSQSTAEGLHAMVWWFLGDLQVYNPRLAALSLALIAAGGGGLFFFFARPLNALLLGDEAAGHVGLPVERYRVLALAVASLLTAAAVAISGLIGFVGLVVPHLTRGLLGPDHRRLIPMTALTGAALLALADGLGRALFYPVETPVGVITAVIGAPFFLWLLRKKQKDVWR